jgi:UPF0755 protein
VISFVNLPANTEKLENVFEVPPGTPFIKVALDLEAKGLISSAEKFKWYSKFTGQTTNVKVGEYLLHTQMKPREILDVITSGQSIAYSFTVPEGHNVFEIRDTLNQILPGRGDELFKIATDATFAQKLTGEKINSLEGYLFPETYTLTKHTPVETLVRRMYEQFQQAIEEAQSLAQVKMPRHNVVILASVIEKETGAPEERPLISSVFHNRLKKGMRLESDPTILYGILVATKEGKKNISKEDIRAPTPYNTYTVRALPAGPISNPGKEALIAAVNPVSSNFLFFVSRNDGTHVFTESYGQHTSAVKTFQLNKKMREGKSWRDLKKKKK